LSLWKTHCKARLHDDDNDHSCCAHLFYRERMELVD